MEKFYTAQELDEMPVGRKLKGPKYIWTKNSDHTWSMDDWYDSRFMGRDFEGEFFAKPNELDSSPAIGARAVEPDLITVEDYVGVEGEIDFGALSIFKLANAMRGASAYEPVSERTLIAAEIFAAELSFKANFGGR